MSLIGEFAGAAVVLAAAVIVLAAHRRSRANPLRATIRMYGMTAGQIAVADEIPLGTAKIRIRDGMQRLRAAYLPEDAGGE